MGISLCCCEGNNDGKNTTMMDSPEKNENAISIHYFFNLIPQKINNSSIFIVNSIIFH